MNNFFLLKILKILIFKIFIILIIIKFMKLNKVTTQLIDLIQKTKDFSLQNYVKDIDSKKLAKILRDLSLVYYNTGETLVSDEVFDYLKDHLEKIDPINDFLNEVGAPIDSKEKVKKEPDMRIDKDEATS